MDSLSRLTIYGSRGFQQRELSLMNYVYFILFFHFSLFSAPSSARRSLCKDRAFVSLNGAELQDGLFLCFCLPTQVPCFLGLFRVLAGDDPVEIANCA